MRQPLFTLEELNLTESQIEILRCGIANHLYHLTVCGELRQALDLDPTFAFVLAGKICERVPQDPRDIVRESVKNVLKQVRRMARAELGSSFLEPTPAKVRLVMTLLEETPVRDGRLLCELRFGLHDGKKRSYLDCAKEFTKENVSYSDRQVRRIILKTLEPIARCLIQDYAKQKFPTVEDIPMAYLHLARRWHNAMRRAGYQTVGQIAQKRPRELIEEVQSLGYVGVGEVTKALQRLGVEAWELYY